MPWSGRHAGILYHRVPDADGDTGDDCRIYTGGICGIERGRILLPLLWWYWTQRWQAHGWLRFFSPLTGVWLPLPEQHSHQSP